MKTTLLFILTLVYLNIFSQATKYPTENTNTIIISLPDKTEKEALKEFANYLQLKGYFIENYNYELYSLSTKEITQFLGKGLNSRGFYTFYIYAFCINKEGSTNIFVSAVITTDSNPFSNSFALKKMQNINSDKTYEGSLFSLIHELVLKYANNSEEVNYSNLVTYTEL